MPESLVDKWWRLFLRIFRGNVAILIIAAVLGLGFNWLMPQGIGLLPPEVSFPLWKHMSLDQAIKAYSNGALFVDSRDPLKYKAQHIWDAVNLPPREMDIFLPLLTDALNKAPIIVVYGHSFSRRSDATVAQLLRQKGFQNVYVLDADFNQWRDAGHPTGQRPYWGTGP